MANKIKKEWKKYVFENGKDYTLDEAIDKAKSAFMLLKNKGIRIDEDMVLNPKKFENDFRLSEIDYAKYVQLFNQLGYAMHDCVTIIKVMDVIYHTFNITKNKAFEATKYAAENHLTVTQTVKDKFDVDFDEIKEFIDTVLNNIYDHFAENKRKYDIQEVMRSIFLGL